MEDWSESNSKPVRKDKLEKRMGRVENLLNYLDGSKTHYLSNQDCVDFDTALPTSVVDDFNAHVASSTVTESFNYLKEHVQLILNTLCFKYYSKKIYRRDKRKELELNMTSLTIRELLIT